MQLAFLLFIGVIYIVVDIFLFFTGWCVDTLWDQHEFCISLA